MQKTLKEIAKLVDGELIGDGAIKITGLNSIDTAKSGDLTFADEKHVEAAKNCAASAVMISKNFGGEIPANTIKVDDSRIAFAKLMENFKPQVDIPEGVSSQAYIGDGAKIAPTAKIMAFAYIADGAEISDGAIIYPHTYIGQNAKIGADGFGFTTSKGVHTKVPQIGNVIIEDDVEIGAHVGIDRAAMGSTVIGHGTKIDNLVHIGHNCKIGANCLIVAQTGISGSTIVGDNVTFGGQVGTVGHIKIGGNSVYAARSGISKNMPEGFFGSGFPIQPHNEWLRTQGAIKKLPDLIKKVQQLEKKLAKDE